MQIRVEQGLRQALDRLIQGRGRHSAHAGRPTRITPASVAREAGCSRNTIYSTHRSILDAIKAANVGPTPATDLAAEIGKLEQTIRDLRTEVRQLRQDKQRLASESLALLQRVLAASPTAARSHP
jgi:HAMP domain-containing protein